MKNLSYQQMVDFLATHEVILIDVQTRRDYEKAHLPGSINLPLEIFDTQIERVVEDKEKPIFVYCQKGVRSLVAVDILMQKGYRKIYHLKDGIM